MRRILLALVPAFWLGTLGAAYATVPDQTDWMTVLLGGRKVGHIQIERERQDGILTTTQMLALDLSRSGKPMHLGNMSRSVEGPAGEPLGFAARTHMSSMDSTVEARPDDSGRYQVTTTVGGQTRTVLMGWPGNALLAEGQRLATVAAGRQAGSSYRMHEFDPSSQQVIDVRVDILGDETVALPGGAMRLSHQRQTLSLAHGRQTLDLWVDDQGIARKGLMSLLGQPLEMLACDRACAMAPNQPVDMLRAATVDSPRWLPAYVRSVPMRYRVHVSGNIGQPFIVTDEQNVTPLGGDDWMIDVGVAHPGRQAPPQPADSKPNAWLQSDAPAIRRLATTAVRGARDDLQRMRRMRQFVSAYITGHGLDVGYASALEVLRSREGDCTEYAVLLAAMARAQGIPARVVSGMVYVDRFGGASRLFIPHEWVQAWVDGRWQSFDSALKHFDSTHLALASGDGDPWHFAATTQLFGNLQIRQAVADMDLSTPVGGAPAAPAGNSGSNGGRGG
ncbi:transglutaminase-like domain-containing protein [Frateuria terrea]|uniref:Transglutaminase-like enzyme, putative cysteine protease n=1 Tax=Frateuria terrea TaxID=529704 RepID=A0A1H6R1C4_9GAMM|nr:transglutaminase-like domain-containing protein [Frateuria terrea]SEI48196.1 Transglutaminase-like enzyme, putative cysteine protease [Frateuria terrea]SFP13906.1 Transglutaminase-like enzyme, putative cysteine protease [Frateuria terrea]